MNLQREDSCTGIKRVSEGRVNFFYAPFLLHTFVHFSGELICNLERNEACWKKILLLGQISSGEYVTSTTDVRIRVNYNAGTQETINNDEHKWILVWETVKIE